MAHNITIKDGTAALIAVKTIELTPGVHLPARMQCDAAGNELKGQRAMSESVPIAIASNQSDVPTKPRRPDTKSCGGAGGGYVSSMVVRAGATTLYGVQGFNAKTAGQFVHIYDSTSLPSDGSSNIPLCILWVPATTNFFWDFGLRGRHFASGVVICSSSTGPFKTIGTGTDLWLDAQYLDSALTG